MLAEVFGPSERAERRRKATDDVRKCHLKKKHNREETHVILQTEIMETSGYERHLPDIPEHLSP